MYHYTSIERSTIVQVKFNNHTQMKEINRLNFISNFKYGAKNTSFRS